MTDTPTHLTRDQVTERFRTKVQELGGVEKAAAAYSVSPQLVSMIQRGIRRPTAEMLKDIRVRHVSVPAHESWEELPSEAAPE